MLNFEGLRVYQLALSYINELYKETGGWPKVHLYSLTDQLRRAGLSIALNIAEGSSRTKKDFRHFLDLSKGSCYESVACLEVSFRQGLIEEENYLNFKNQLYDLTRMISGLKNSLV